MCVTGNKWVVEWRSATDGTGNPLNIGRVATLDGLSEGTAEPVNDSDLSTDTYERYCKPDLADQDPVVATLVFDPTEADFDHASSPAIKVNEEGHLTITSQLMTAGNTPAEWKGSAIIISMGIQEVSNNVRVLRDVGFKWSNAPNLFTYTAETTP